MKQLNWLRNVILVRSAGSTNVEDKDFIMKLERMKQYWMLVKISLIETNLLSVIRF